MSSLLFQAFEDTQGVSDTVALMISNPAARAPEVAEELEREAALEGAIPAKAERLSEIAAFVRKIHALTDTFLEVRDLPTLVAWHATSAYSFSMGLTELLRTFSADAVRSGDKARARALRRGLAQMVKLHRLVRTLNRAFAEGPEHFSEWLSRFPALCSGAFVRWLELSAEITLESDPGASRQLREAREVLVDRARLLTALKAAETAAPGEDGRVLARIPTSRRVAEQWFLHLGINKLLIPIAQRLAKKEITYREAMSAIETSAPAENDKGERATFLSAFLEMALLVAGPAVASEALSAYRALLDLPSAEEPQVHATLSLHYGTALVVHFHWLANQCAALEDGHAALSRSLVKLSAETAPRLVRDLRFTRARIAENLGNWSTSYFEQAASDLREGLAVKAASHEREPRGRALGDLANVLRHQNLDDNLDGAFIGIYDEALTCLPAEESPFARSIVLNNYATYMQERPFDDVAKNKERALTLINEAILILGEQDIEGPVAILKPLVASAHLTRGNVLMSRAFANPKVPLANTDAAIESYRAGMKALGRLDHEIAGLLRLNLGLAHVDRYHALHDMACLGEADRSFHQAAEDLATRPRFAALARLERALLVLYEDAPEPGHIDASVVEVTEAAETLALFGTPHEAAGAQTDLGALLEHQAIRRGAPALEAAGRAFNGGFRRYQKMGDHRRAISAARRAGRVAMALHKETGDRANLAEARKALAQAAALVEELLGKHDTIEWRTEISCRFAPVYADLLWCQALLGEPVSVLWESSCRAKSRELLGHVSWLGRLASDIDPERRERIEEIRREVSRIQVASMERRPVADPDISLWEELDAPAEAVERLFDRMRLLGWNAKLPSGIEVEARLRAALTAAPETIVIDFNVSQLGTTCLVHLRGENRVCKAPLTTGRLHEMLWGKDGWCALYGRYRNTHSSEKSSIRLELHEATERLLDALSTELLMPALGALLEELRVSRLLVIPGVLAGLPLHAGRLGAGPEERLFEVVRGFAYLPTAAALTPIAKKGAPRKVLCVLSAPSSTASGEEVSSLPETPHEVAEVATRFSKLGASVTVIASVGLTKGREAFSNLGIDLPPEIEVLEERPTPMALLRLLAEYDLVHYSGHGFSSGLLLVDAEGRRKDFDTNELLGMPELRLGPFIHLSACETAYEDSAGLSELWSFVASLLRRGAGFVAAGLWFVYDQWARRFSAALYEELLTGAAPDIAFREALVTVKRAAEKQGVPGTFSWAPFAGFLGA